MKRHLPALLVLLASLALYSGGARAQDTDVNGNPVDPEGIWVGWNLSNFHYEANVGEIIPVSRISLTTRHTTFDDPNSPNGISLSVPGVDVVITVDNGATISDGTTTTSSSLTVTTDSTGFAQLYDWTAGPEPGDYSLTATVPGSIHPDATATLTATVTANPDDPDTPDDPAPRQPLRDLTTDTTLGGIGGINNSIRRHLEQLRRRQQE